MENSQNQPKISVTLIKKPPRKLLIRRGVKAEEYFDYCAEVGCDVWERLYAMIPEPDGEPICLWLPKAYVKKGTSVYVQGVEFAESAEITVPENFDEIRLPAALYLMFRGEPFPDKEYAAAIGQVKAFMEQYDPAAFGYMWDDDSPRIQLEPRGERGYIELRAVRKV